MGRYAWFPASKKQFWLTVVMAVLLTMIAVARWVLVASGYDELLTAGFWTLMAIVAWIRTGAWRGLPA